MLQHGVDIDKHLTWKSHIAKIKLCIRKKVGILYRPCRLRNFVPRNSLILLYQTFMQPHITYGIEVWGGARKVDLNSILLAAGARRRFAPRHLGSVFCALFGNGAV